MKLFEYEAKSIFSRYGIQVPPGELATTPSQARRIATQLNAPVAVKAQILVGGRGRAGGILFADSAAEAELAAKKLLGFRIKDIRVQSVVVEERIPIRRELYFGIIVDRSNRSYMTVASSRGGMEIEEMAATTPEKIIKDAIDPLYGFRPYHARQIAKDMGYAGIQMLNLANFFLKHYNIVMDYDAELIETNPLVETPEGKFVAVDARLIIDQNSMYRHPELRERLVPGEEGELTPRELKAQREGVAYVELDGDIGVIGNGAGLVMATLDIIKLCGGRPANFLDVGGGASADRMVKALSVVLSDRRVRVVFINILGGITKCDEIAKGILKIKGRMGFQKPMVIRLVGTNEQEGQRTLKGAGIYVLNSMEEAVKRAVEIAKSGG